MITYNDYWLAHHGVQGQRWGVRNAEWYPIAEWEASKDHNKRDRIAARSERKLNKLQKKNDKLKGKLDKGKKKETKAIAKAAKAIKRKGANNPKANELLGKSLVAQYKVNKLEEKIQKTQGKMDKLIEHLRKNGFNVRDNVLNQELRAAMVKLPALDFDGDRVTIGGKVFNASHLDGRLVDYKHLGEEWLTDNDYQGYKQTKIPKEEAAKMMRDAREKDEYNIDFLERVQNDPVLRVGGKELQKEYAKFLKDPGDYLSNFKSSSYRDQLLERPDVKAAIAKSREKGWDSLSEEEKKLLEGWD